MERTKRCSGCGDVKPLSAFHRMTQSRDGYQRECKACNLERVADRRRREAEKINRLAAVARKARVAAAREEVLAALGGRCGECGIDDRRVLDVDHIHGGGRAHRRRLGSGRTYWRSILNNLQAHRLLCKNCNWLAYLASLDQKVAA